MTQARKAANKLATSSSDRAHAYALEVKPMFSSH